PRRVEPRPASASRPVRPPTVPGCAYAGDRGLRRRRVAPVRHSGERPGSPPGPPDRTGDQHRRSLSSADPSSTGLPRPRLQTRRFPGGRAGCRADPVAADVPGAPAIVDRIRVQRGSGVRGRRRSSRDGIVTSPQRALPWPSRPRVFGETAGLARSGAAPGASAPTHALSAPLMLLAGAGRRMLLAIVLLDIPLQIDTNFNYLDNPADWGAIGGFNVSATTVALSALYVGWLVQCVVDRGGRDRVPLALGPLVSYAAIAAASLVVARGARLYARGLFLLLPIVLP